MHFVSQEARARLEVILSKYSAAKVARQLNVSEASIAAFLSEWTMSRANLRDLLLIEHFALLSVENQETLMVDLWETPRKPRSRSYLGKFIDRLRLKPKRHSNTV